MFARRTNSSRAMTETRDESLSIAMNSLPRGGIIRLNAWGKMTYRITWALLQPRE